MKNNQILIDFGLSKLVRCCLIGLSFVKQLINQFFFGGETTGLQYVLYEKFFMFKESFLILVLVMGEIIILHLTTILITLYPANEIFKYK